VNKSPKLSLSTRQAIGRYKSKYPTATIGEIAGKYNCTYAQARNAIEQYKEGKLNRERPRKKDVSKILQENNSVDLFKKQFDLSLAFLEKDETMPVGERVMLLDKLAGINKTLQQISLQNHLKRTDAEFIARIIRRYEPQASDDRIIKIYHEELTLWKNSL
jgi:transposase-like protein